MAVGEQLTRPDAQGGRWEFENLPPNHDDARWLSEEYEPAPPDSFPRAFSRLGLVNPVRNLPQPEKSAEVRQAARGGRGL